MSEQVIISDKYDHIPGRKVEEIHQYGLKFVQFEDRCTDSERAWRFTQQDSEVTLTEMPYEEVDAWADVEIAALARLENDETAKRISELTSALLKATTVIVATPAEGANPACVNRVVDLFAGTMRAVTKRDGAFIDTEDRLIINQTGEMAKRAKADPYDASDEVPFAFTLASLGKLERLKAALADDPDLMTTQDKVGRSIIHPPVQNGRVEVVRYLLENGADPNASSRDTRMPLLSVPCQRSPLDRVCGLYGRPCSRSMPSSMQYSRMCLLNSELIRQLSTTRQTRLCIALRIWDSARGSWRHFLRRESTRRFKTRRERRRSTWSMPISIQNWWSS